MYAILICGLIIIAGGIYLVISQSYAVGFLWPRYGERNAGKIYVGGTSTIITGSLLCIFPIYQLIKQRKRK